MTLNESIKKSSLKYVQCLHGGLHTGQVMNMVCVDASCNHRGLICPICRMDHHEGHQILPIKSFLQNIRSLFLQSDNNEDLNNLSDYLRALQNAKKEIIGTLRSEVAKLADSFKALQQKIEQNFSSVRKNVLIQSSITTKLPSLLTLLTEENANKQPQFIQQQFKKYTQLLKYENQKLKVSDKAKTLVQNYSTIPTKLGEILGNHSNDFIKRLQGLPKFFQERQEGKQSQNKSSEGSYTFSTQNKFFDILLQENNKLAKLSQEAEQIGYIFVNENKGQQNQKIVFEIVSNASSRITIGLGDVEKFRNTCSFIYDGTMNSQKDYYCFKNSNGAPQQIDSSDSEDMSGKQAPFVTGDIIEVEYNGTQITFLNRSTQQKSLQTPNFSQQAKKNLQFVIGLCESDSIRILNQ